MSETYFPNPNGMPGTPQDNGFPPISQPRSYQPGADVGFGPAYGTPGGPPFGGPSQSGHPKQRSPRLLAVLVALTILTLALGVFSFMQHDDLGAARSEVAARSDSLAKANDSLQSTQADLDKTKQQLAATEKLAKDAMSCATVLQEVVNAVVAGDSARAQTAYEASQQACEPVFAK
jgi:hypothetical protein